ncbi:hypothetical protein BSIN_2398 [Burkholderia singularis]|uniref:Uncharacterized protein n=1 Tax=Burkholderia singularis TaxID=1503053 RepID=A0A238H1P6_9BURK|nr:hypothetical protein BSIN_2398 [Burkholderia singularis]
MALNGPAKEFRIWRANAFTSCVGLAEISAYRNVFVESERAHSARRRHTEARA